ncbi:methyltransferase family protein [Kordiimonas laminariae]|uniref:methyltransferase family protein n=1 Tax=Kordiimonas laminariae TaxID=2917717 RepID=UPI001FF6BE88|nr:isoprenylcysteine carboxylmethyltransferase family protein [Kordiimonas laminariae]MCK0069035.1 isoprenylcysteine carboxylmethyltransferase family protein [Kordiimonas laminariae]
MFTAEFIVLWGPVALINIALIWGFSRILFLSRKESVSVLSVLSKKKTLSESMASAVAIVLDGYLLIRPFIPKLDQLVYSFTHPFSVFGVALMALGIGIAILSQIDMGKSWRIGIPENKEDSQNLITGGLYSYSRNPIYVGIMIFVIGATLAVSGPITIFSMLATAILIGKIIEDEEAFMRQSFGEEYDCYCKRVRRWL